MPDRASRRHPRTPESPPSERACKAGLLALFVLVPLLYHPRLFAFDLLPKRLAVQLALLAVALVWIADVRSGRALPLHRTRLNLPVLAYLFALTLSFSQALNPVTGLVHLAHHLTFALLFFAVAATLSPAAVPPLLRAGAGVGILVSLLGILEARGFSMDWLISNGRPSATFGYRNFAASYLIMNIPLALALFAGGKNRREIALGILSAGLMLVFLVYTRARGAWAGLSGALLLTALLALYARSRWKVRFGLSTELRSKPVAGLALAVLLLTLGLSLLPPRIAGGQARAIDEKKVELLDALTSVAAPGADRERKHMWLRTLEVLRDHPLLGVGPGNWQYAYPRYDGGVMLRPGAAPERPHNDLLWIASESGLPGLAVYLWVLLAAAATLLRVLRSPQRPEHARYALALGASLLAVLGHSLFSFPRERVETSLLFWAGLGILALLDAPRPAPGAKRPGAPLARAVLHLIPLLIACAAWLTLRQIRFDAHYLESRQYQAGGDYRSALREASLALRHGPFDAQAFLMRAKGHQSVGMLQQARMDCLEGLRYHPLSLQLLGDLGTCYALLDSLDRAEACYRKVLELSPTYYQMYSNLGAIYQKRGDLEAAVEAYKQALKQPDRQNRIATYNNLGLAYLAGGRADDAIQAFLQALELAPEELWIYHNLGDACYEKSVQDRSALSPALDAYERFLRLFDRQNGPPGQAAAARQRVAEIRARLRGAP